MSSPMTYRVPTQTQKLGRGLQCSRKAGKRSVAALAIKLICTDVDGTLLTSQQELPEAVKAAVQSASSAGIPTIVATGKARGPWAAAVLPHLPTMPGVFLQGLALYNADGTILHEETLRPDIAERCIQFADKYTLTLTAYCGDRIVTQQTNEHTDRLVFYAEPTPEAVGPLSQCIAGIDGQDGLAAHKMIFMAAEGRIQEIRSAAQEALGGEASLTRALPGMLEVLPIGASKGAGVQRLLRHLNIEASEVMAIGDGENDIEMLQLVKVGVAMGNASAAVKRAALTEVPSNDKDGVAVAIQRLLNGEYDQL